MRRTLFSVSFAMIAFAPMSASFAVGEPPVLLGPRVTLHPRPAATHSAPPPTPDAAKSDVAASTPSDQAASAMPPAEQAAHDKPPNEKIAAEQPAQASTPAPAQAAASPQAPASQAQATAAGQSPSPDAQADASAPSRTPASPIRQVGPAVAAAPKAQPESETAAASSFAAAPSKPTTAAAAPVPASQNPAVAAALPVAAPQAPALASDERAYKPRRLRGRPPEAVIGAKGFAYVPKDQPAKPQKASYETVYDFREDCGWSRGALTGTGPFGVCVLN